MQTNCKLRKSLHSVTILLVNEFEYACGGSWLVFATVSGNCSNCQQKPSQYFYSTNYHVYMIKCALQFYRKSTLQTNCKLRKSLRSVTILLVNEFEYTRSGSWLVFATVSGNCSNFRQKPSQYFYSTNYHVYMIKCALQFYRKSTLPKSLFHNYCSTNQIMSNVGF